MIDLGYSHSHNIPESNQLQIPYNRVTNYSCVDVLSPQNLSPFDNIPKMITAPKQHRRNVSLHSSHSKRVLSSKQVGSMIPKEVEDSLNKWQIAYKKSWERGKMQSIVKKTNNNPRQQLSKLFD
jgi:hypothetical protein